MAEITRRGFVGGAALAGVAAAAGEMALSVQPAVAEEASELVASATLNPQDYNYTDTDSDLSAVFSEWNFGPLHLNHRIVKPAAGSDTQKNVEEICTYYANFARGGVEMVFVEDCLDKYEHFPMTRGLPLDQAPLQELADAVHEAGAYIGYQISCMGINFSGTDGTSGFSSAVAGDMTHEEIETFIADSVNFVKTLQSYGWDAVEINAAGNNVGQSFFSRQRNKRDDEYGPQSIENRSRFVGDILRGIKEECPGMAVQVLINGIEENDTNLGDSSLMTTVEENVEIAKYLEAAGADSIIVRLGPLGMHVCQFAADLWFTGYGIEGTTGYGTQYDFSQHWQGKLDASHGGAGMTIDICKMYKDAVSIPIGTVTYMDPAHAPKFFNDAIAEGKVDFYEINRPLTVDTEYVNKLREGRLDEIAPCTRCMHCHFDYNTEGAVYEHCRVNACTQRAFRDAMPEGFELPALAGDPKKVMVIGGGPAGMEAARIAAYRGHDVTLFEKNGMLGGTLPFASTVKGPHENLDQLNAYLQRQLELAGVAVELGVTVDAAKVAEVAPDAVVLACGGETVSCGLAGESFSVVELEGMLFAEIGERVVILGSNCRAIDAALWLQAHGKKVTMITPDALGAVDKGQSNWVKTFVMPMLYARGMRVWPNASIIGTGDHTVTIKGETGVDMVIPCDTLVNASDLIPATGLLDEIDVPVKVAVGDCAAPFNIAEAIASANLAARAL